MKLTALLLVVLCAVQLTSAGFFQKFQEKLSPPLILRPLSIPQRAKVMINKIQNSLSRRPQSNFTMPTLGGGTRKKNVTEATEVTEVTEVTEATLLIDDVTKAPPPKHSAKDADTCGGSILVDLKSKKIQTFKSTKFPSARSKPYSCSWSIKVGKNCRLGRLTMTVLPGSRLANELQCTKGYLRVAPFMKEAKICGSLESVPPFTWMVDQSQTPEEVNIVMKNIGLNDGQSEGLGFSVSGECLNDVVKSADVSTTNLELSSQWLQDIQQLQDVKDITLYSHMSLLPASKLSAVANEKISVDEPAPTSSIRTRINQKMADIYAKYIKKE